MPLRLRAVAIWRLPGHDLRATHMYRLRPGQKRRVRFTVAVTPDVVQRYTECQVAVKIIGRPGRVTTAP